MLLSSTKFVGDRLPYRATVCVFFDRLPALAKPIEIIECCTNGKHNTESKLASGFALLSTAQHCSLFENESRISQYNEFFCYSLYHNFIKKETIMSPLIDSKP